MKNYESVTIEFFCLSNEDVVTTSGTNDLYEGDFFA